ncbi:Mpv17 / PMP22 family protein [Oesophagostomum dentatum]|uniref:Mitochondrial inner membrane protein Mpv17 n=1 Tax=Oesophagostomum dentatum TaxID=61180 RepID=A0A0B1TBV8_OESDE|nr:Mpv17 / PMP22 family protein [Oesophagostomum dentatum]
MSNMAKDLPSNYAPIYNRWFAVLEKVRGNPKIVPVYRVAIDQLGFAPFVNAMILLNLRLMERLGLETSWRKMKEDWWSVYTASLTLWPAGQLINFYLVPFNMRVVFVQVIAFFWNAYLSYRTQTISSVDTTRCELILALLDIFL